MIKLGDKTYYTSEEVKEMFKVDKNYFSSQISKGLIPRSKIGKSYLFSEQDLQTWIENNKVVGAEEHQKKNKLDIDYLLKFIEVNSIEVIKDFLINSDEETILNESAWIVECTTNDKKDEIKAYLKGIAIA